MHYCFFHFLLSPSNAHTHTQQYPPPPLQTNFPHTSFPPSSLPTFLFPTSSPVFSLYTTTHTTPLFPPHLQLCQSHFPFSSWKKNPNSSHTSNPLPFPHTAYFPFTQQTATLHSLTSPMCGRAAQLSMQLLRSTSPSTWATTSQFSWSDICLFKQ